jgi:vacuolar-type H+-ATPase subunit I/STV1
MVNTYIIIDIMKSKSNIKAKKALERMSKTGDMDYNGLNSNQPTLFPGTNVVDNYRAMEAADIIDTKQQRYIDTLELSKRIMEIDNKFYGVLDDVAHELIDYMEQREFDVLQDLDMEYNIKKKELKDKANELADLNIEDYLTEEDYKRVALYKVKQINTYRMRLEYLKLIIKTIKDYIKELSETENLPGARNAVNDFSYNFTNNNNDLTSAGRLK